jgi:hypothetical protein
MSLLWKIPVIAGDIGEKALARAVLTCNSPLLAARDGTEFSNIPLYRRSEAEPT